jgi:nucleoside-diphosphate-sugar epimerase
LDECEKNLPPIHILPGEPVKIEDLANLVIEYTGGNSKIFFTKGRDYDVEKFYGDPSRMRDHLGLSCSTDIRKGLIKTIQLFKSHIAGKGGNNF